MFHNNPGLFAPLSSLGKGSAWQFLCLGPKYNLRSFGDIVNYFIFMLLNDDEQWLWNSIQNFIPKKINYIFLVFHNEALFYHLSLLPAFLQLVFQPHMSGQTDFSIVPWWPSGLDYWSLILQLPIHVTKDLSTVMKQKVNEWFTEKHSAKVNHIWAKSQIT